MALLVIKNKLLNVTNNTIINLFKKYTFKLLKKKPVLVYETKVKRLENGLRIATQDVNQPICTVGLWIESGARWETRCTNGIAHFHEHLIYQGVPELAEKLNKIPTELSSFTTREIIGYYGSCLPAQVPNLMECFSDIVKFTKFDNDTISCEREKTLREMEVNDSNYKKIVFDFLHQTAFQGTSLGQPTFGTTENVKNFRQKDIAEYVKENYQASRMVLSVTGLVCHDELCDVAKDYFGKLPSETCYVDACRFTGSEIRYRDDSLDHVYAAIAVETCPLCDDDFMPLTVAASIIGSYYSEPYAINHPSKLIRAAAEDSMCHHFQSFHINYSDTGLWGIYFEGDPLKAENMVYNIQTEWMKLCTIVTKSEVERGKKRLKTILGRQITGTEEICISIGRQLLYSTGSMEIQEIFRKIDSVTKKDVKNVCMKYIYDQCPAVSVVGPVEAFPDYLRLRSGMFWLRF